jgi:TolB-like protein
MALWQDDGSHPSTAGTYLAACVFYAIVFRQSPAGLGFDDGLSSDITNTLQRAAAVNVLANPGQWGLH